ncbi:hypothetical protein D9V30_09920 [Mycetocola reblochoni]|uniref:Archaeal/vacuolar-type H+-ATPase subunit A n=2 Tax=Mycetocola reblochoni TaxID=331618 RepID=A0A1R4JN38_9MICO|nr:hypothetical protein D9V30_09920 [Mycetocola reblochoni]SJN33213.1 Archaeal/vacuolar-type H+-ATPase subunit A [Mycetocola reblochoni REB411]
MVTSGFISVDTDRLFTAAAAVWDRAEQLQSCLDDCGRHDGLGGEGFVQARGALAVLVEDCVRLARTLRQAAERSEEGETAISAGLSAAGPGFAPVASGYAEPVGAAAFVVLATERVVGARADPRSARRYAAIAARLSGAGEGPVSARAGDPEPVRAPATLAAHLERIPDGGPQLRIDRYPGSRGGSDTVVAYISGTRDDPDGSEPFDLSSNLAGVSGRVGASQRAVEQALSDAGVAEGDRVHLVGYSQGALIASRIAADGRFPVESTTGFGSPGDGIVPGRGVAALTVRHSDDPVPVLSGGEPSGHDPGRVVVTAPSGAGAAAAVGAAGHARERYLRTASAADRAADPRVVGHVSAIVPPGAVGESRGYRLTEHTELSRRGRSGAPSSGGR